MNYKKWGSACMSLILGCLILMGGVTVIIDPFFHYHAPLPFLSYDLFYQRYQNDGIVKHFDYDAIITGNSMSECFKASELDALFEVKSVKVPFSGASHRELDNILRAAIKANPDIKLVLMSLDWRNFISDKDEMSYEKEDYPEFLYNSNPFDDVKYLFNKHIFKHSLNVLYDTLTGSDINDMDRYGNWGVNPATVYGLEAILTEYNTPVWEHADPLELDEGRFELMKGNLEQNIISFVRENPQIDFYYFMPTYSMFFWVGKYNQGEISLMLEAQQAAIEMLLEYDNMHLFSFVDDFELAQDYSRYKDYIHYDADVNSRILKSMAEGEHRLTKDNYMDYIARCRQFYLSFDYEAFLTEIFGEE